MTNFESITLRDNRVASWFQRKDGQWVGIRGYTQAVDPWQAARDMDLFSSKQEAERWARNG